jgi:hypothetical protein
MMPPGLHFVHNNAARVIFTAFVIECLASIVNYEEVTI